MNLSLTGLSRIEQSRTSSCDFIDDNKLNNFIHDIFLLNVPSELREIGERIHPRTGKSNYDEHREQIYKYIDDIRTFILEPGKTKSYIMSTIKYGDANTIDINLYIHKKYIDTSLIRDKKQDLSLNFYFVCKISV